MHQAGIVRTAGEYLLAVMEAYAAAVSKNLQEELARAEFNLDQVRQERQEYARRICEALGGDTVTPNIITIKRLRARISELEKEKP